MVYNTARIALSERTRDLASMRVLGFTRGEISYILLGELALITLLAIPLGLVIGRVLAWYMIQEIPREIFRVPLIIENSTYALSATVVIIAAIMLVVGMLMLLAVLVFGWDRVGPRFHLFSAAMVSLGSILSASPSIST